MVRKTLKGQLSKVRQDLATARRKEAEVRELLEGKETEKKALEEELERRKREEEAVIFYSATIMNDTDLKGHYNARDSGYNGSWDAYLASRSISSGKYGGVEDFLGDNSVQNGLKRLQKVIQIERDLGVNFSQIAAQVDPIKKRFENGYKGQD